MFSSTLEQEQYFVSPHNHFYNSVSEDFVVKPIYTLVSSPGTVIGFACRTSDTAYGKIN